MTDDDERMAKALKRFAEESGTHIKASKLIDQGQYQDAFEHLLNKAGTISLSMPVDDELVEKYTRLVDNHPPAKAKFVERRDFLEIQIKKSGPSLREHTEWELLNRMLGVKEQQAAALIEKMSTNRSEKGDMNLAFAVEFNLETLMSAQRLDLIEPKLHQLFFRLQMEFMPFETEQLFPGSNSAEQYFELRFQHFMEVALPFFEACVFLNKLDAANVTAQKLLFVSRDRQATRQELHDRAGKAGNAEFAKQFQGKD